MKRIFVFPLGFLLSAFLAFNISAQDGPAIAKSTVKSSSAPASTSSKVVTGETIEQDVAEALSVIEDNHVVGSKIDYNNVFKSSIDSMLHSLDPHSNYFDAKEFEQFRTDQSSRY
ncbi:MAG: hypothetical protein LC734_07550, partial [Acidobacteria bacterium]|nr:hypothetical protein [Acidobacteriota bacterium]